jgi:hypothetical protein
VEAKMAIEDDPRFKAWQEVWTKKRLYEEFFSVVSMRFHSDHTLYHEARQARDKAHSDYNEVVYGWHE